VENENHNHPFAASGSLPRHRKLDPLDYHRVTNMLHDDHTPRQVIDLLHAEKEQLGDITASTNDLNNILDRPMHQYKSGKISSEALVEHLEESQLSFDYWTESAKRLKGSLTINPPELELVKAYGSRAAHALRVPDESIQDAATPYSSRCGDKSGIASAWLRSLTTEQYTKELEVHGAFIDEEQLPTQVVITGHETSLTTASVCKGIPEYGTLAKLSVVPKPVSVVMNMTV
jgi:hypothetical protein